MRKNEDGSRASRPNRGSERLRDVHGKPRMLSSISTPTPSKPVIIPTRTQPPKSRRSRTDSSPVPSANTLAQDPKAIPPSMAALLAVASVQNQHTLAMRRNASGQFLHKESLSPDDLRYALSSSSPKSWSILQSSPDEEESKECDGDASSVTSASTIAPLSSYRSLSSDSMPSLDMELDLESPASPNLPTPAMRLRGGFRRPKIHSPRASLSDNEHPLSPSLLVKPDTSTQSQENVAMNLPTRSSAPIPTPRSPFQSNLTASIRLLKSAARSLSDITPTNYSPDPLPRPRTVMTETTRPESIKPRVSSPLPFTNIDGLPLHLHLASPMPTLPPSTASIQLMPYVPSTLPTSAFATAPPVFLPAAVPSVTEELDKKVALPRPREPRENSDFLRVVVLEMNMRRVGKLAGEGRARIWLGPRTDGQYRNEQTEHSGEGDDGGFIVEGVVGASDEVEQAVLQEQGEVGVDSTRVGLPQPVLSENEYAMQGTSSQTVAGKRPIPSRWVGITP